MLFPFGILNHTPYFPFASSGAAGAISSFAFAVAIPGLGHWRRARVAHLGRLRRGHRSGRLRWEDRMASYSEASLGLPWRTAALDRLLWQDEATRYAVHGLAFSAGWRRLYSVWVPHNGP